jgi:site-specific recombinase XerD
MSTANVDIPLRSIPDGKSQLSLVRDSKPKLMDQLRESLRSRHYSRRTEQTYCSWVKRFIFFHNVRHPKEMAEPEINAFLTHLAVKEKVSASTQNQALSALLFLYRNLISCEVSDLGKVIRARKPKRLPVVMTRDEVKAVLANLAGDKRLMATIMYGAGLRLMECLHLRVQDIDFLEMKSLFGTARGPKTVSPCSPNRLKPPSSTISRR